MGAFGAPLDLLGDPWGSFAISLGRVGSSWPTLGRPLAPLWAHFADPCPLLATIWCTLASFLMPLGSHMGLKGHLCAPLGNLRCFFDMFFVRVSHSPKFFVAFSVLFSLRSSCRFFLIVVCLLFLCRLASDQQCSEIAEPFYSLNALPVPMLRQVFLHRHRIW